MHIIKWLDYFDPYNPSSGMGPFPMEFATCNKLA